MKEDGEMIFYLMAATLLSPAAMAPEGLDRDLHEFFFDSGINTSSDFVRQPHKHP